MIRRRTSLYHAILVALLALAHAAILLAQSAETGQLVGTVTDQTGGVIVGASVRLQSATRTQTVTTNLQGLNVFDQVQPGRYTVTVAYDGFEKFVAQVGRQLAAGRRTIGHDPDTGDGA